MKDVGANIKRCMIKQQEAKARFQAKKIEFLNSKEQITRDIEEARTIWEQTLKQLPEQPFNQ